MAIALAGIGSFAAQAPAKRDKELTPEQKAYQAESARWLKQREALRMKAQAALDAERARETSGTCPEASATRDAELCLQAEMTKTQAYYDEFAGSIRAMLGLEAPAIPGELPPNGPTGRPPTAAENVKEFDQLEADSKSYRDLASIAAYNRYKGGSFAPVFEAQTDLRLLQIHFQEVASIYESLLANR